MSPLRDAASGSFGALCLVAAGNPLDVVKTRVQTQLVPRGVLPTLLATMREEGVFALWRGSGAALASALTENVTVFAVNGALTRAVLTREALQSQADGGATARGSLVLHALLGGLSGVVSATAICPAEVVKCRMQVAHSSGRALGGALGVAVGIARTEGLRGLFAGLGPLLARDVPLNTIMFSTFRAVSRALTPPGEAAAPPGSWQDLLAGGIAGAAAWAAVYPLDVVKSRAQVAGADGGTHSSSWQTLRTVLREGGPRGLYRGCSAALARAFVANGALFWGVELAGAMLGSERRG